MDESTDEYVQKTVKMVLYDFIHNEGTPHVHDAVEINSGYCRRFASRVLKRLGSLSKVTRQDAEDIHTWVEVDGKHYDAEVVGGVDDPHDLPIWERLTDSRREHAAEACSVLNHTKFRE
ncbi:hypothetical protein [Haloarcula sp. H-GB5]